MPTPPVAERRQHASTHHGITRQDPYHWLRADNWQEVMQDPSTLPADIRSYIEAENAYFAEAFETAHETLVDKIYREIRGRIKEDESGIPSADGPWAYNSRMEEGKQYPILVRTPRDGGDEQVLLDCNVEAGEDYFGFGGGDHDPSHRLLAWSADRQGSEFYTLNIRDLATGEDTGEIIEDVAGGGVWSADSSAIYYSEYDDNHRPFRVRRHVLGTPQADDEIVYEEKDPGFFVGVDETLSRNYIVIDAHDHQTSEFWLIDTRTGGAPKLVSPRLVDREYDVEDRDGVFYILTNADGAEDFKIVTVAADNPAADNWIDLVPHRPGVLILDIILLSQHLIRLERSEGLPRIVVRNLDDGEEWTVKFDEEAYALGMSAGFEFDTTTIRFTYSSPTTPSRTYDLDLVTRERTLLKEQVVPSGHNPDDYETRRIFATARDGERVPVTLLYRKGLELDGKAPALLYGYGAYGHALTAGFSVSKLSLVDRGFVHATAHIRGGMDKGYAWYKNGRREHKTNTFTDFIAAAETLIELGYTSKQRIVAEGGSAGGLLMGAVTNMRPDLWAGVIAEVPFVDVLNTMLDETLPLTPPEWPEWGNPIADKAAYDRIAGYAPYEQVAARDYPPIFALAGLTDPRVTYWEPAKWVAKLRATKTDGNALYLKTHMGAGHGGASGRFDQLKETGLSYAFALSCVGLA
ncbi:MULTISPECIES: S9 family peptidase [unclassified Devosia]|uniref:S9 family peptidase n=1 Tax=unclassified Devosia TaxID=196773 RepID=UPI00095E3A35|nr:MULTISPECIES: S9 family peptidase [unclassified Devosia]MBN9360393.1 S9 family peptidase [Devosia sp.]OJX22405.1 MAG: S9 family peptidase [Devosia sp. 66-14]